MYIYKITIMNVRSIASLDWSVPDEQAPGWHVFLGNNGAGKSTVVRAVALALVGPARAAALRQNWRNWLRVGTAEGGVRLDLLFDSQIDAIMATFRDSAVGADQIVVASSDIDQTKS